MIQIRKDVGKPIDLISGLHAMNNLKHVQPVKNDSLYEGRSADQACGCSHYCLPRTDRIMTFVEKEDIINSEQTSAFSVASVPRWKGYRRTSSWECFDREYMWQLPPDILLAFSNSISSAFLNGTALNYAWLAAHQHAPSP